MVSLNKGCWRKVEVSLLFYTLSLIVGLVTAGPVSAISLNFLKYEV